MQAAAPATQSANPQATDLSNLCITRAVRGLCKGSLNLVRQRPRRHVFMGWHVGLLLARRVQALRQHARPTLSLVEHQLQTLMQGRVSLCERPACVQIQALVGRQRNVHAPSALTHKVGTEQLAQHTAGQARRLARLAQGQCKPSASAAPSCSSVTTQRWSNTNWQLPCASSVRVAGPSAGLATARLLAPDLGSQCDVPVYEIKHTGFKRRIKPASPAVVPGHATLTGPSWELIHLKCDLCLRADPVGCPIQRDLY